MIFSELYGTYYNTVAAILTEAVAHPVSDENIREIIKKYAFSESIWAISDAIKEERWQLLKSDGTTPITKKPSMPLTVLQKRWLKAIGCDPRLKLFGNICFDFPEVEPLFEPADYIVFDKYADGDDYTNETYIFNFRLILDAIKNSYPLEIEILNRKGNRARYVVLPKYLEYSEKDDKFRLISAGNRFGSTINLGRIISCAPYEKTFAVTQDNSNLKRPRTVVFELKDERKALERVLLHFAHFEKTAERIEEGRYLITIHYDEEDETEMVIRILSFGPMIRVTAPAHFVDLMKQRLLEQKSCED
ncbi:MAG: WYL domain-containing protein [Lachnospiraceae bacterium]|jgi:hypothetical protein